MIKRYLGELGKNGKKTNFEILFTISGRGDAGSEPKKIDIMKLIYFN